MRAQTELLQDQQRRAQQSQLKAQLVRELGSSDNGFALRALEELRAHNWVEDGSLVGADLFTANLSRANLNGALLNEASFRFAILKNARMRFASLEGARSLTSSQLFEMKELRGAVMPDGSKYDGRFNLYGDLRNIEKEGFQPDDPISMSEFYGVSVSEYNSGQEWFNDYQHNNDESQPETESRLIAQQVVAGLMERLEGSSSPLANAPNLPLKSQRDHAMILQF